MRRAEWVTVLRYGHLRSAPVVVDVALRTEREPPTLHTALCVLLAPRRRLDGLPPLRDEGDRHFAVVTAWIGKAERTLEQVAIAEQLRRSWILLPSRTVDAPPRPAVPQSGS